MEKQVVFNSMIGHLSRNGGNQTDASRIGLSFGLPDNLSDAIDGCIQPDLVMKATKYPNTIVAIFCIGSEDDHAQKSNETLESLRKLQNYTNVIGVFAYPYEGCFYTKNYFLKQFGHNEIVDSDGLLSNIEAYFLVPSKYTFNLGAMTSKIWSIANDLLGTFQQHEYGEIILPLVVIKRMAQTFESREREFWATVAKIKEESPNIADDAAYMAAMAELEITFCNIFDGGLDTVVSDPYNAFDILRDYIDGFMVNGPDSNAIKYILNKLNIDTVIRKLSASNKGYSILNKVFDPTIDLSTTSVSTSDMGQIFETLIYKFNVAAGDGAGQHYTAPDIVKTMSALLTDLVDVNGFTTLEAYDMAMGTSQMLTVLDDFFNAKYGESRQLVLNGQEINGYTYGIACADALLRGVNIDDVSKNFTHGDTLSRDNFSGRLFDYIISNPPFGISWSAEADEVISEYNRAGGRFPYGLPAKSDGQMLFMCNGLAKLKKHGAMAIIQNGSPLFNGGNGSGEAAIREGLLSNDYVTAIIKLPKEMFYNTGIVTYIWVVQKNKAIERSNKVWLIDASNCYKKLAKAIGNKRNDITDACREAILKAFNSMDDDKFEVEGLKDAYCSVKIVDPQSFKGEADSQGRYKWEIPFDKLFAESTNRESSDIIAKRIIKTAKEMNKHLVNLFGTEVIEGTEEV